MIAEEPSSQSSSDPRNPIREESAPLVPLRRYTSKFQTHQRLRPSINFQPEHDMRESLFSSGTR